VFIFTPESVFTLNRNGCSASIGIGVQHRPEYALAIDIFDEDYQAKIDKIKLPKIKIKIKRLQKLLEKAIGEVAKTNKFQATDFTKRFNALKCPKRVLVEKL
jgi:hypothetical protein